MGKRDIAERKRQFSEFYKEVITFLKENYNWKAVGLYLDNNPECIDYIYQGYQSYCSGGVDWKTQVTKTAELMEENF